MVILPVIGWLEGKDASGGREGLSPSRTLPKGGDEREAVVFQGA
jgi:hypothetical protein